MNLKKSLENRELFKLGDSITLYPCTGKKRRVKLTRLMLKLSTEQSCDQSYFQRVYISSLGKEELSYTMKIEKSDNIEYFVLSSDKDELIKVNGVYCRSCIVEIGDEVWLGHNRLSFHSVEEDRKRFFQPFSNYGISKRILSSSLPVLIEGQTGTGKTTLAKWIHDQSNTVGDFVHVNLASFSANLIESELFGHKKGAFTGAISDRVGALVQANYGTLFLDEIDSLSKEIQTKLLTFLDNGEFRPVGSSRTIKVNFRLIVASGQNLQSLVSLNQFREDFYYRISSGHIHQLESLTQNRDLIDRVVFKFCSDNELKLSKELLELYKKVHWPGNLRQLKGHLNKKMICSKTRVLSFDRYDEALLFPPEKELKLDEALTIKEVKSNYAKIIYYRYNQNISATTRVLDITPLTLKRLVS